MQFLRRLYRFLGSVKFAVVIILSIAIISAVGTIVESRYNAEIAGTLIYRSLYMQVILIALSICLIISALHRIPWKRKHIPFLTAHVGLLVLIFGSWLTMQYGIDGSMVLANEKSNSFVSLSEKDLTIYVSRNGSKFTTLLKEEVNFFKEKPDISLQLPEGEFVIDDYKPFALKNSKIVESKELGRGPAIRFVLKNDNVELSEWVLHRGQREERLDMGPASIILTTDKNYKIEKQNAIVLYTQGEKLKYTIFYAAKPSKSGMIEEGDVIDSGWMGLNFHLISYFPVAEEQIDFIERDYPNELTTEAIHLNFLGKSHWIEMNSIFRIFTDQAAYYVIYGNRQIDIKLPLRLADFQMQKYPGTDRAASYASLVRLVNKDKEVLISMNEPLKEGGYTFYQASFKQDALGRPTASILSVNYDPGRFWKYLGSLLVVLGCIMLFYMRKYYMKGKA